MNSRERILISLNPKEPGRVPYYLASSAWTGIANVAYKNLLTYIGMVAEQTEWADVIQQIVMPSEKILDRFGVDTRELMPLTIHSWNVDDKLTDAGENWEYLTHGTSHIISRRKTETGFYL